MFKEPCYAVAMQKKSINLRPYREALGLSITDTAAQLGVSRQTLSRWETGAREVPPESREKICTLLRISPSEVNWLTTRPARWRIAQSGDLAIPPVRRPYPVGGTLDEMLRLGPMAEQIHAAARAQLTDEEHRIIVNEFPRDTPHELLFILMVVADGGRLVRSSPARFRCPMLVMDDFLPDLGADQMQWALEWERDDERFVIFGQVRIKAAYVKWGARVDFLVFYKKRGKRRQWTYVEFNGRHHLTQEMQDNERAEGLLIPELRYDNPKLLVELWFVRFKEDLRTSAEQGAKRERERLQRAATARTERLDQIAARRSTA